MNKILYLFGGFFVSLIIFLNLGNILDVSETPKKSDVIISLGGGDNLRIKKAIELYENGFSRKTLIIVTGGTTFTKLDRNQDSRIKYINSLGKDLNYIYNPDTKSTFEEIIFLEKYMNENNLSKVIIVSDPYHMLRIKMLINLIDFENKELCLVRTNPDWWDDKNYYKNGLALKLTLYEILKIPHNFFKYILQRG